MASLDKVYKQIEVFARECDAEKVVLFGSRARGDNLPKSDIDIAVAGCRDFGRFSYLLVMMGPGVKTISPVFWL